ncbi:MAG: hypothetical protein H0U49_03480, partial [Parachlamydiaceae bacterium]|nr:hypothetical protein [Parachlamydiaceae bacterium]
LAPYLEIKTRDEFASHEEFANYTLILDKTLGIEKIFEDMVKDKEKLYSLSLEYAETLPEAKQGLFLQYIKQEYTREKLLKKQEALLEEMKLKDKSIQLKELEWSLVYRLTKITSKNYVYDGKPGTDKTPEEYRQLTFGGKVCKKITSLITYGTAILVTAYAIRFFCSKT